MRASNVEAAWNKAESCLASVRTDHAHYHEVAMPAYLEEAQRQAAEDYLQSDDFNSGMVTQYKEGMWDMKAEFNMYNPTVDGVDWSFVPEVSEEIVAEEHEDQVEEGEVTGATRVPKEVVILDEPE